jgi:mRNA-degrading endonuclease toxin of MazEF toxin-antitoxin module
VNHSWFKTITPLITTVRTVAGMILLHALINLDLFTLQILAQQITIISVRRWQVHVSLYTSCNWGLSCALYTKRMK